MPENGESLEGQNPHGCYPETQGPYEQIPKQIRTSVHANLKL